jgi:hypothetical protein
MPLGISGGSREGRTLLSATVCYGSAAGGVDTREMLIWMFDEHVCRWGLLIGPGHSLVDGGGAGAGGIRSTSDEMLLKLSIQDFGSFTVAKVGKVVMETDGA